MKINGLIHFAITMTLFSVGNVALAGVQSQDHRTLNMLGYDYVYLQSIELDKFSPPLKFESDFSEVLRQLDKSLIPMIEDVFGKKLKNYKVLVARKFCGEAYQGPHYVTPSFPHASDLFSCTEATLNFADGKSVDIRFTIDDLFIWNPISGQLIEGSMVFQFRSPRDPFEEIYINARYDLINETLYYQSSDESQIISCKTGPKDNIWYRIAISKQSGLQTYLVTFDQDELMPQIEHGCSSVGVDKIKCINKTSEILLEIYRPVAPLIEKFIVTKKYFNADGTEYRTLRSELICE